MKIDDIVKIILMATYKNLDEIAYENDSEETNSIDKKDVSFLKEFIQIYFLFSKKQEEFLKNVNNYKINDQELAKELSLLEKKLIEMGKENFYKIDEKTDKLFYKILNIKNKSKKDRRLIEIRTAKDSIYSIIWFYYKQLLFNQKNIDEINKMLGYEFLALGLNQNLFKTFLLNVGEENSKKTDNNYNIEERNFIEMTKILLKKYDMIAKVYKNGGEEQVKRL